jgi:gliding motility-associated-like protein
LSSNQLEYCQGEQVIFNATSFTGEISYKWYEGIFPNGILLETTLSPTFVMQPTLGEHLYYVIVESANCTSNASASFLIEVIEPPDATVDDAFVTVCEGDQVMITTENVITDFEYTWFGPNGFFSSEPTAIVSQSASLADQGIYKLIVANGECNSDTASVQVVVFDKPIKPIIEAENIICPGGTIMIRVSNLTDADQYTWLLNGSLFSNQNNNTLIIDNAQASHSGFWQVFVEDNFCRSDSSATIQISVESQIQIGATNDGPVCEGDSVQLTVTSIPNAQYLWVGPNGVESLDQNPKIKAVAGSYEVILTTEAGCISTTNTVVDTRIPPEITALSNSSTPCMDGMTDVALVSTIFPQAEYLYQWQGPNGYNSTDSLPIISDFSSENNGVYLVQVSDGLCISELAQTNIQVVDIPESPVLQAPNSLCEGDILEITIENNGDGAELFHWETPKGLFTQSSPSFVVSNVTLSDAGVYVVSSSVNGCSSRPSTPVNVRVNVKPIPPVPQSNSPVCEGETIELKAPFISGVEYEWVGPNSFSSNARNPEIFEATNANEGAYIMRILKESCPSPWSEAIFVNVKETPPLPLINQEDLEFCRTDLPASITLCLDEASTIEGSIYDWEVLNLDLLISRTVSNCISFDDFDKLISGENLISVFADRNGCFAPVSDPLTIRINDIPTVEADAGSDILICEEGEIIVNANNSESVTGFWASNDGNVSFQSVNSKQSLVEGLKTGENLVFWTLIDPLCGIYSRDSLIIMVESIPMAEDDVYISAYNEEFQFSPLENDIVPENYTLEVLSPAIGGELTVEAEEFFYSPRSSFIGSDRIVYRLCNTSCPDICSDAEILIQIGEANDCFTSTIITPNQDGSNDYMVIPCLESGNYPSNSLIVFNIWGDEVFAVSPYRNNWDGRHSGQILPAGTYYFVLDLKDGNPAIRGFIIIEQ